MPASPTFVKLSDKQRIILETMLDFKKKNGRFPCTKELGELLPWKPTNNALWFSLHYLLEKDCIEKVPVPAGTKIEVIKGQEKLARLLEVTGFGLHVLKNSTFVRTETPVKERDLSKFVVTEEEDELQTMMESI